MYSFLSGERDRIYYLDLVFIFFLLHTIRKKLDHISLKFIYVLYAYTDMLLGFLML